LALFIDRPFFSDSNSSTALENMAANSYQTVPYDDPSSNQNDSNYKNDDEVDTESLLLSSSDDGMEVQQLSPTVMYIYRPSQLSPFLPLHSQPSSDSPILGVLRQKCIVRGCLRSADDDGWVYVVVGGRGGWCCRRIFVRDEWKKENFGDLEYYGSLSEFSSPEDSPLFALHRLHSFPVYTAWLGNHYFFWKGRLMFGSDFPLLLGTVAMITGILVVFWCQVFPKIGTGEHGESEDASSGSLNLSVGLTTVVLTIVTFYTLFRTALTDPGIIPARSSPHKPPVPKVSERSI